LGLAAQRKTVEDYLNGDDWNLIEELVEIESGKSNQRPKLMEAIDLCKASGATLVVAKIDRLTRDAAFLLSLKDGGIDFIAADMPEANRMTIGIMALVAEQEWEAISKRIKDALAAAKARGVQLGAYKDGKYVGRTLGQQKVLRRPQRAVQRSTGAVQWRSYQCSKKSDPNGSMSLRGIAQRLNDMNVPTVSERGLWYANSVRRLKAIA